MAGVPAGRLSIEIVAEIARLQQDLDKAKRMVNAASGEIAKSARAANDNLGSMGSGIARAGSTSKLASHHVQNLAFQFQDLAVSLASGQKPMTVLMQQGSQIGAIMGQAGIGVGGLVKQVGSMAGGFARAHPVIVAVTAALAAGYGQLQLWASQSGANEHLEKFRNSLGLTKDELEKMGPASVTVGDMLMGLWKTFDEIFGIQEKLKFLGEVFVALFGGLVTAAKGTMAFVYAAFVGTVTGIAAAWSDLPKMVGEAAINAANLAIRATEELINKVISSLNTVAGAINDIFGTSLGTLNAVDFTEIENTFEGAGSRVGNAFAEAYSKAFNDAMGGMNAFGERLTGNIREAGEERLRKQAQGLIDDRTDKKVREASNRRAEALARELAATEALIAGLLGTADAYRVSTAEGLKAEIVVKALEKGIRKQADVTAYVSQQIRKAAAEQTVGAAKTAAALRDETDARRLVNNQVEQGLITSDQAAQILADEAQLRPYLATMLLAEGEARQKLGQVIAWLREEQKRANDEAERTKSLQAGKEFKELLKSLQDEHKLRGLVGVAREEAALALEREAFEAEWTKKGLKDAAGAWEQYYSERLRGIHEESALERDRREAELLASELERLVDVMSNLGGAGSALGGLLAFLSGDIGGIRGPLGDLLNTSIGGFRDVLDESGKKTGEIIARTLGTELQDVFGANGPFGKTLQGVLQSAGMGMMAGSAVFGRQGTVGQLGSALGGVLGEEAGKAIGKSIGGLLGKLGGPLGSIAGGILGSLGGKLLGDLLGSAKRGSAIFGAGGMLGEYGNNSANKVAASQLAAEAVDALAQIAEQFGADLNTAAGKVSIGIRDGSLFLDPQGRGYTKQSQYHDIKGFGQDSQAAIAAAIQDLIGDGVLSGIRAGTQNLLSGSGDFQKQLDKALAFEGVFKALEEEADPAAAALKKLESEFAALGKIFDEAGATTEERAKLEELYQLRKAELAEEIAEIENDTSKRRELEIALLTAQGRYTDALAAARADELAQLEPSLRAIKQQIWAEQEARDRRELEIQLMEAQGDAAGALAARREIELAQTQEGLRFLKEQIWAAQDAAAEKERLARAEAEAARAAEEAARAQEEAAKAAQQLADAQRAATRAAEQEAAAKAKAIADERAGLLSTISQLMGAAAAREDELAKLDPSNQAIQRRINALQDEIAATNGAAETIEEVRRQMLLSGDAAGYVAARFRDAEAAYGLAGTSGNRRIDSLMGQLSGANVRQTNAILERIEALMNQTARRELSVNALRVENVGEALYAIRNRLGPQYGDANVPGVAGVRERLWRDAVDGSAIDMLIRNFHRVQTAAGDLAAEMAHIADEGRDIMNVGLGSIQFYFKSLTSMTEELAQNGSEASQAIDQVTSAIGRMNSFATVFTESADAARRGGSLLSQFGSEEFQLSAGDLRTLGVADRIAVAAKEAAAMLITQQASGIVDAIEGTDAFAGVPDALKKQAALLLEGIGAYDIPAFEAAFIRMSDALANGTINVAQFNTLFEYSQDVFEDTAAAMSAMSADVMSDLREIISILDDGIAKLVGNSRELTQLTEDRALAYLRSIKGVPDLNDTFRDAVSTVSSLNADRFSSQVEFLRELGQRSGLLGELRENAVEELGALEQVADHTGEMVDQLKTTNEKLDALNERLARSESRLASIAASNANLSDLEDRRERYGVLTRSE